MKTNKVPVDQARRTLGDLVIGAEHGEVTILTRYGKRAAAIVPVADVEELQAYRLGTYPDPPTPENRARAEADRADADA